MADPDDDIDRQLAQLAAAVGRAQRVQQEVDAILGRPAWRLDAEGCWRIDGRHCWIWMQQRPHYCDRGQWLAHVELQPVVDAHKHVHLDNADGWPRYYFDVERAKLEVEAWLRKRGQIP
jgi:hypothetical protein